MEDRTPDSFNMYKQYSFAASYSFKHSVRSDYKIINYDLEYPGTCSIIRWVMLTHDNAIVYAIERPDIIALNTSGQANLLYPFEMTQIGCFSIAV